jgi:ribosomal protein S18 acetylase RimI-like enzyme
MTIGVRSARREDLPALALLFDGYRRFYRQASDLELAEQFLSERFEKQQSVILLAEDETGAALGFTQLYTSFSSVSAAPILILNDLYVYAQSRGRGVGAALLAAAEAHAIEAGAVRLSLSTGVENLSAQGLYERAGWRRVEDFFVYEKSPTEPTRA